MNPGNCSMGPSRAKPIGRAPALTIIPTGWYAAVGRRGEMRRAVFWSVPFDAKGLSSCLG